MASNHFLLLPVTTVGMRQRCYTRGSTRPKNRIS